MAQHLARLPPRSAMSTMQKRAAQHQRALPIKLLSKAYTLLIVLICLFFKMLQNAALCACSSPAAQALWFSALALSCLEVHERGDSTRACVWPGLSVLV
jgi:hypothetical protein